MSTSNDQPIAVLNGLIETTLDSAYGYREAAVDTRDPAFKRLFEGRWLQRKQWTSELQAEVRRLGGTPDEGGTMLAAARRISFDRRNSMAGSDQSIIDEVEAGEDQIKARFEAALAGEELPPAVKAVVTRVFASVHADHDQMRELKHALHAQAAA